MKFVDLPVIRTLRRRQAPLKLPRWLRWVGVTVVVGYLAYAPLVDLPFQNSQRALIFAYAIVGLGLNLLTGLTGQISLGHGAFFALGAYVAGVLIGIQGWPYLWAIPVAAVLGFGVGWLFGRPVLRLKGLSLALVTLSLALITPSIIKRFEGVTHGRDGIVLDTAHPPAGLGLAQDQWTYYLALATMLLCLVLCQRLARGRIGRSLVGIRDAETVVATLGVRPSTLKTNIFGVSTAFAAVGGVIYGYATQFVGPDAFGLDLAIAFITMVVVGGLGSNLGAILGAAFIVLMPTWTQEVSQSASGLMYGVVLVVFMFVMPFGLIGLVRAFGRAVANRLPWRHAETAPPLLESKSP